MTGRSADLGRLSRLAADYLDEAGAVDDAILRAEAERRQVENDVIVAMIAIKRARAERRSFNDLERILLDRAEDQVRRGVQPPALFKPILRSGHRPHQTMLSLADDGVDHLDVTLRDPDLLDGVVVHHEVIARSGSDGLPDLTIAPYRMVDIRLNGLVRLHAADDVPVSVYAGRPNYQLTSWLPSEPRAWDVAEAYRADPISPSHIAAATASAAFANGVADVKFSFEGLTVLQAIDFMVRVNESVDKRDDQSLSTQFNLNRPLLDDRPTGGGIHPTLVNECAAIAHLAIEMTRAGGWNRVTLDSASRAIPSRPCIALLDFRDFVRWVDAAHAAGLETYISGGMSAEHIALATYTAVDGIGLGFWIHGYDEISRGVGRLDADRIRQAIRVRNDAEVSPRGCAARLLARLHVGYGVGSAPAGTVISHSEVFQAVLSCDEIGLAPIVERAKTLGLT